MVSSSSSTSLLLMLTCFLPKCGVHGLGKTLAFSRSSIAYDDSDVWPAVEMRSLLVDDDQRIREFCCCCECCCFCWCWLVGFLPPPPPESDAPVDGFHEDRLVIQLGLSLTTSGRRVGRHAQMMPEASSPTDQAALATFS